MYSNVFLFLYPHDSLPTAPRPAVSYHLFSRTTTAPRLTAQRLHRNHVLSEGVRKLDDAEQRVRQTLDGLDAGAEGQQEDVDPREQEADGPADEDEEQEPEDGPQDARTEIGPAATFARRHLGVLVEISSSRFDGMNKLEAWCARDNGGNSKSFTFKTSSLCSCPVPSSRKLNCHLSVINGGYYWQA